MLQRILHPLVLCFFCNSIFPQDGFYKKHFLPEAMTAACRDVIEAPNGNFIMCGIIVDTAGIQKLAIIGTDPSGNIIWKKYYGDAAFMYLDNDYHMRGPVLKDSSCFYHALCALDSLNKTFGVLLKFDYNGDTIWQRIYREVPPKDLIPQGLSYSVDGGLLITGFSQNWGSDGGGRTCLVLKTDKNGKELWRKRIYKEEPNVQDGQSIVQDSASKRIVISGYQYIGNGTFGNILILDSLGNKIHQTTFNNDGGGFPGLIQLRDKNFVTSGSLNAFNDKGALKRYRPLAVKFDIDGNVIWKKVYDTLSPFTYISFLHELPSGDLMMAGHLDTMRNYGLAGPVKMRLYKTDQDGNLKWKRYIGRAFTINTSEYTRSMNPTANGGFIFAGWNTLGPGGKPLIIVKVDSLGCDSTPAHCRMVDEVGISEYPSESGRLILYPNPVDQTLRVSVKQTDNLSLQNASVVVYDILGKIVKTESLRENAAEIDTGKFPPGLFTIHVQSGNKISAIGKFIVDR
jgi:hypothetical protein